MKLISKDELRVGDIFAREIKLHGRQAFHITKIENDKIFGYCRNDIKKQEKRFFIDGPVYLLHNLPT